MSTEVVILAENLGKRYFLTHRRGGRSQYTALRDVIADGVRNFFSAWLFSKDRSRRTDMEKFLDTPVKHYSSGMYMRLAFAVAAHLEPEILVIDEVLAVGDAAFQKKCLGKMGYVAKEGRTVLFVSHNMAAVTQLCRNAIHLQNGRVVDSGPAANVVNRYLALGQSDAATVDLRDFPTRTGSGTVRFEWGEMRGSEGEARRDFSIGEDVIVAFRFQAGPGFHERQVRLAIQLRTSDGISLCNM